MNDKMFFFFMFSIFMLFKINNSKMNWFSMMFFIFCLMLPMMFLNSSMMDLLFIGYSFSLSTLSYSLVILSMWISILMLMSSYSITQMSYFSVYFNMLIYLLLYILMLTFLVSDYLMFYFFFEASLIPTLMIIMGWGYNPERLQAGLYFLFYTITASLPLLLMLIFIGMNNMSYEFFFLGSMNMKNKILVLTIGMVLSFAFLIKLPMFMVHLWLPKAHVEAPVAGSMILAGVLLKLGGYGLMNLSLKLSFFYLMYSGYFIGLSLMGMVIVGFMCMRVNDFKALVAYSSVAHMAMVVSGVMSYYLWGFSGALVMMVAHGLSSSGLFSIVNMYYERMGSRSFYINKGLIMMFPIFSMLIFFLAAANMAAPPTINLLSEILLMGSIMSYDYFMLLIFPLGSFMGAVFTLFMFSYSQHGKMFNMMYGIIPVNFREIHVLGMHIYPVNFMVMCSSFLIMY